MPRGGSNRLSSARKKFTGTLNKTRERRSQSNRSIKPIGVVGDPPDDFTKVQKAAWRELAPQVAHSYSVSDRATFSLLAKLYAMVEHPPRGLPHYAFVQMTSRVLGLLEAFGCSPRSRRLVESITPPPTCDPRPDAHDDTPLFGPGLHIDESRRLDTTAQPPARGVK